MFKSSTSRLRLLLVLVVLTGIAGGVAALILLRGEAAGSRQPDSTSERMSAELVRAADRAGICSAANAVGVGLRGEYFPETSLHGDAALVRVDGVIDFDSSMDWPSGSAARPASVRWSGWIKPPLSGGYQFHADAPNMRVLVARNLVAGDGVAPGTKVDLAAGRFYPVEVVVNEITNSDARFKLEWTAPHGARYVIPKALLHLPSETVASPGS